MGWILVAIALLVLDLCGAPNALSQLRNTTGKEASVDLVLHSPVALTPTEGQKLRAQIRKFAWNPTGWDQAEEIVRELYQDKGFFKVDVATVRTPTIKENVLVFRVNPGKRYYLVRISWRGSTAFPESELANLISFRPGELFNRSKIARGLSAAQKLYASLGFINFICMPTPEIDDEAATIALKMDIDEGRQFRFGELHVEGMEEAQRKILLSAWQGLLGRPYNVEDADKFFSRHFRSPWANVRPENYTTREIDEANHSVNYFLQFVPWLRYRVRGSRLQLVENP